MPDVCPRTWGLAAEGAEAPASRQRWGECFCGLCAPVPPQARPANDLEPHPPRVASAGRATPGTPCLAALWATSCLPDAGDTAPWYLYSSGRDTHSTKGHII